MQVRAASAYVVNTYNLTGVGGGDAADLKCVLTQKYDSAQHWDECANHKTAGTYDGRVHQTGGVIGTKTNHVKTNNGVVNDCNPYSPYRIESCSCGWSQNIPKLNHIPGSIAFAGKGYDYHAIDCSVCNHYILGETCTSSTGVAANCGTAITCATCKGITDGLHYTAASLRADGNYRCDRCSIILGTGTVTLVSAKDFEIKWRQTGKVTLPGYTRNISQFDVWANNYGNTGLLEFTTMMNSSTTTSWDYTVTMLADKANTETLYTPLGTTTISNGGRGTTMRVYPRNLGIQISNDVTPPSTITYTTSPVITSGVWGIQRDITVTCFDSTTNYVDIGLFNSAGSQLVAYGRAVQSGNNWSRTFRLAIDAPSSGANFIVRCRDRSGNVGERTINLSYTDAIAPTVVSLTGYSTVWTKNKTLRLNTNELGSGNVEIAFNKSTDYCLAQKSGTNYYRDFIFEGTVPTPVEQSFLVKDSLGNATTYKYTIGYLDNTLPTITVTQNPDTTGSTWYKGDLVLTVTLFDGHSGLKTLTVPTGCTPAGNIDLDGVKNAVRTFVVREPGTYNFTITDTAGNSVTKSISVVKLDNTNPILAA